MSRFVPAFLVAVTRQTHSVRASWATNKTCINVYPDTDATLVHSLLIAYNMRIIHKGTDQNFM